MALTWGKLYSLDAKVPNVNFKICREYSFGSASSCFADLSCSLGTEIISPIHFTIPREPSSPKHPKPVYLTNKSDLGTFINGDLLQNKDERRILLSEDVIGVPEKPQIYSFPDFEYHPTIEKIYPDPMTSQYYIESAVIGSGGYGSVKIGHHVKTCKKYAVKVIKENLLATPSLEAATMVCLDHPCIVSLHKVFHSESYEYVFMELLVESLYERIARSNGFLPEQQVKVLFMQLANAVEYMHGQDIVHRDIKAKNIMLDSKEPFARLKLIDFGTARVSLALKSFVGTEL